MKIFKTLYYMSITTHIFFFLFTILIINSASGLTAIPVNFAIGALSFKFNLNLFLFIPIMVTLYALVALTGTGILGSGLNDESVSIIKKVSSAIIIYVTISVFTTTITSLLVGFLRDLINIFLGFGYFMYVIQDSSVVTE